MSEKTMKKGVIYLTDKNFRETIKNVKTAVLVDFFADWCGPCQMAAPIIDKLAQEYQDKIVIAKMNVDDNPDTAQDYSVMSIPTVIIFKNKENKIEELAKQVGFPGETGYRKMIEAVI